MPTGQGVHGVSAAAERAEENMAVSPRRFIEKNLYIRTKNATIVPLKLNPAQVRLYEVLEGQRKAKKPMRVIILKARQLGFSTLAEALIFQRTATKKNVNSLIIAHREDSTANLFKMSKLFFEQMPDELRPMHKNSNARELVFENPERDPEKKAKDPGLMSRIRCNTAGGGGVGRSDTIHNVHASEFAFWAGDKTATWVGIMQAVPAEPETMVIVESTANGYDEFHRMWEAAVRGENDFVPLFFPWFENPEYRKKVAPCTQWSEEEKALAAEYGLDEEQLAWRRWCIRNNCAGDERMFRQEYPSCPDEAFLTTGQSVFDNDKAARRRTEVPQPVSRGCFQYDMGADMLSLQNIRWVEQPEGIIRIYEKPRPRRHYVVGGDTAGVGSDWFVGQVLDNCTGNQVAVLRHQYDEDQYARQMYCLGCYYNDALLGVETNYSTYPVKMLSLLGYPRLYVRELVDTYNGGMKEAFGFETTSRTRPVMIAQLVAAFREHPESICDGDTLGEMMTFQYNQDRRPEAMAGEHDDLVMALAIAHYIRTQQEVLDEPEPGMTALWTRDMREDYARADEEGRRVLEGLWGKPR
jgi:hypothetical protein